MATVREQIALSGYTTLRLGGPARRLAEPAAEAEIVAEVAAADQRGEPVLVLGGGSNLVIPDEGFPGTVVRIAGRGTRRDVPAEVGDAVDLTVAAGEEWDSVVAGCVADGLAGIECLSGIPGLAGATPVQNVGAYGQEVAGTITGVRAYDRQRGTVTCLPAGECGFAYRTSAFKRQAQQAARMDRWAGATGRFVVLAVTFRLARSPLSQPVRYRELASRLGVPEGGRAPLADVRAAVLALRRGKGMLLDSDDPDTRSAGSFFTNPVLDAAAFARLRQVVARSHGPGARIPHYPAPSGRVKVPAAWLIEQAGFWKGYPGKPGAWPGSRATGPRISSRHTLALVNPGGATTASLVELAGEIRDTVRRRFGVELTPEPVLVGTSLG
jgi:UDP-N-acetylmuramate dehydrogenase